MIAIVTRYHGPTDTKGARISARTANGQRITIGYDHSLNSPRAHRKAALALCARMGWGTDLIGGALATGYVFVFPDRDRDDTQEAGQ